MRLGLEILLIKNRLAHGSWSTTPPVSPGLAAATSELFRGPCQKPASPTGWGPSGCSVRQAICTPSGLTAPYLHVGPLGRPRGNGGGPRALLSDGTLMGSFVQQGVALIEESCGLIHHGQLRLFGQVLCADGAPIHGKLRAVLHA